MVDGSLHPIPVCDVDQEVVRDLMTENRGLTLLNLKKKTGYSSVTTTSGECYNKQETAAISTPVPNADDHLSEIASSMPGESGRVDPEAKHLPTQLLMEEVDLGESTPGRLVHLLITMRSQCGTQVALQVIFVALNRHPCGGGLRGT